MYVCVSVYLWCVYGLHVWDVGGGQYVCMVCVHGVYDLCGRVFGVGVCLWDMYMVYDVRVCVVCVVYECVCL